MGQNALSESAWPYFLRMLVTLGLVLGVLWLFFRFLRKAGRPKAAQQSSVLVLASVPLGTGRWLYVVSLGSKAFLLGATDSSVSLIHEVEDRELIDEMRLRAETAQPVDTRDFKTLLSGLLKPASKHRAESATGIPGTDFLSRQRDRLRKF
ncbi:MAG TPA: flagellar biosynthetic protein FliO [Magnetospirillaceae bacterium]|nr:flagellar biosynthetic protein FliO [Magnetospirillaceae bacterium]